MSNFTFLWILPLWVDASREETHLRERKRNVHEKFFHRNMAGWGDALDLMHLTHNSWGTA